MRSQGIGSAAGVLTGIMVATACSSVLRRACRLPALSPGHGSDDFVIFKRCAGL